MGGGGFRTPKKDYAIFEQPLINCILFVLKDASSTEDQFLCFSEKEIDIDAITCIEPTAIDDTVMTGHGGV